MAADSPIEKLYIFYWQDSQDRYRNNTYTQQLRDLEYKCLREVERQKKFEFVMVNINRKSDEYKQNSNLVEKYRPQKLKCYPLVVIDRDKEFIVVNSDGKLKAIEALFENIYDSYFV